MKALGKLLVGILFSVTFSVFLFLTTLYFLLLNPSFLFPVFDKYQIYERVPQLLTTSLPNDPNLTQEERLAYARVAGKITSVRAKTIVEGNVKQVLDFIHGRSKDVVVFLPAKELGLSGRDVNISLLNSAPASMREILMLANNSGFKIFLLWMAVLTILIGFFVAYGQLGEPKSLLGGWTLLLVSGAAVLVFSLAARLFLAQIGLELAKEGEPSQVILGLLATSLFPELLTYWLVAGGVLVAVAVILNRYERLYHKH